MEILAKSKPLPEEDEIILRKNLWDLYDSEPISKDPKSNE